MLNMQMLRLEFKSVFGQTNFFMLGERTFKWFSKQAHEYLRGAFWTVVQEQLVVGCLENSRTTKGDRAVISYSQKYGSDETRWNHTRSGRFPT